MDLHIELNLEREEAQALPYDVVEAATHLDVPSVPGMPHAKFADPVSLVVALGAVLIAERIVDHWLTSREQGVMIDLSGERPRTSRVHGVPAGVLMVINEDGSKEITRFDYDKRSNLKDLITNVLDRFRRKDKSG